MKDFYKEDLGITDEQAERIATFMDLPSHKSMINRQPWAKYGKARVYFKLWSQNSLPAIDRHYSDSAYFDADENDVFISRTSYGFTEVIALSRLAGMSRSNFSGAKTRAKIEDLAKVFYEQQ